LFVGLGGGGRSTFRLERGNAKEWTFYRGGKKGTTGGLWPRYEKRARKPGNIEGDDCFFHAVVKGNQLSKV